jgi:hypothetical protein
MSGAKSVIILIAVSIIAAVFLAGCTSPTPTIAPTITPAPTVPPAISPAPTPIGGSDDAVIDFSYVIHSSGTTFGNLLPSPDGWLYYALDVTVDSDKPVSTDGSWFTVEYRRSGAEDIKTYQITTVIDYPQKTIGNGSKPATGRLLIMLPSPDNGSYGPVPIYFKPLEQQEGQYKVRTPVRGVMLR